MHNNVLPVSLPEANARNLPALRHDADRKGEVFARERMPTATITQPRASGTEENGRYQHENVSVLSRDR